MKVLLIRRARGQDREPAASSLLSSSGPEGLCDLPKVTQREAKPAEKQRGLDSQSVLFPQGLLSLTKTKQNKNTPGSLNPVQVFKLIFSTIKTD